VAILGGLSFPLIQLIPLIPWGNWLDDGLGPIQGGHLVFDVLVHWFHSVYRVVDHIGEKKERHATATRDSLKVQILQNIQTCGQTGFQKEP
jgi:hypothetical protein